MEVCGGLLYISEIGKSQNRYIMVHLHKNLKYVNLQYKRLIKRYISIYTSVSGINPLFVGLWDSLGDVVCVCPWIRIY